MFADYQSLVLEDYTRKKASDEASSRLGFPTPANLKDECLIEFEKRVEGKGELALRTFFGQHEGRDGYLQAIKKCDRDKFKPLVNFLRDPTIDTHHKNIELLAWLIDFKPRPFEVWKKSTQNGLAAQATSPSKTLITDDKVNPPVGLIDNKADEDTGHPKQNDNRKQKNNAKVRMAGVAILVLMLVGLLGYWFRNNNDGGCMYWAGDHYQQIPCDQKVANTLVIALDDHKLNNFKKITDISTINKRSKREVWYVKVYDTIEFYTSEGFHPTELQLRLKPVTDYIIDKYVLKTP